MTKKTTKVDESEKEETTKECGCAKEDVPQQTQADVAHVQNSDEEPENADGDIKTQATGKQEAKAPKKKAPEPPADDDDDDDDDDDEESVEQAKLKAKFAELEKKQLELEAKLAPKTETPTPKPTALVASDKEHVKSWETLGKEALRSIKEHQSYAFDIDMNSMYKQVVSKTTNFANPLVGMPKEKLTETFSTSGTIPGIDIDRDFLLIPGGTYMKPVRQYCKFEVVPQGADRARFFTSTIPAAASQTPGSLPSDSTYTLTAVEVVPSTISGQVNTIHTDNLEDYPVDLVKATTQAAVARMMDFEANAVFNTAAAAATPYKWLKGSDGTVITGDDTASVSFSAAAIAAGRRYLELQGYPVDRLVLALAPQQYNELLTDSNIVRYVQANFGTGANISTTGIIERYLGVELLVTNKVAYAANTTNHALRAILFVNNWTFGMGVKRDLTIKMHEYPEDNEIIVTANWRVSAVVLDANSFIQISSTTTQTGQNG